ncbi:hypothetical protein [Bosea sp. UNC402CLCol]|uniref:hypothetical protein n=1 Tax=Bosea sp. UNC402CLCol TaxID=1510531 RepID=UPI0012E0497E|nr:hypothetical protein [Bosea sp. UNC402CLCol]
MAGKGTHTAAFAHFGTKPHNVQWSWSARNEATKTVVVTFFQDEFRRESDRLIYERPREAAIALASSPGHNELTRNLIWARDNCDGELKAIVAIAKDRTSLPRSIAECHPSKMKVRLVELDDNTGAFRVEAEL